MIQIILLFSVVWLTTIDIETGGHGDNFHSGVITVENETTSDIVQSRFPSADNEFPQMEEIRLILRK